MVAEKSPGFSSLSMTEVWGQLGYMVCSRTAWHTKILPKEQIKKGGLGTLLYESISLLKESNTLSSLPGLAMGSGGLWLYKDNEAHLLILQSMIGRVYDGPVD